MNREDFSARSFAFASPLVSYTMDLNGDGAHMGTARGSLNVPTATQNS